MRRPLPSQCPPQYHRLIDWCIALAKEGKTQKEIMQITGCSRSVAWQAFKKAKQLEQTPSEQQPPSEQTPSEQLTQEQPTELQPQIEVEKVEVKQIPPELREFEAPEIPIEEEQLPKPAITEDEVKALIEFPFDIVARITECEKLKLTPEESSKLAPITTKVLNKYLPDTLVKYGDLVIFTAMWVPTLALKVSIYKQWQKEKQKQKEQSKPETPLKEEKPMLPKETKAEITTAETPPKPPTLPQNLREQILSKL